MYIAIVWFIGRVLDLFTTQLNLTNRSFVNEGNPLMRFTLEHGYLVFPLFYITTAIVYVLDVKLKDIKILRSILRLIVCLTFIVSIYNLLEYLFIK